MAVQISDTRKSLLEQVEKWQTVEHLVKDQGFLLFLAEFQEKRAKQYRSLLGMTEHVPMLRYAARVELLDEILSWVDRATEEGKTAARTLNETRFDEDEE